MKLNDLFNLRFFWWRMDSERETCWPVKKQKQRKIHENKYWTCDYGYEKSYFRLWKWHFSEEIHFFIEKMQFPCDNMTYQMNNSSISMENVWIQIEQFQHHQQERKKFKVEKELLLLSQDHQTFSSQTIYLQYCEQCYSNQNLRLGHFLTSSFSCSFGRTKLFFHPLYLFICSNQPNKLTNTRVRQSFSNKKMPQFQWEWQPSRCKK